MSEALCLIEDLGLSDDNYKILRRRSPPTMFPDLSKPIKLRKESAPKLTSILNIKDGVIVEDIMGYIAKDIAYLCSQNSLC